MHSACNYADRGQPATAESVLGKTTLTLMAHENSLRGALPRCRLTSSEPVSAVLHHSVIEPVASLRPCSPFSYTALHRASPITHHHASLSSSGVP